MLTVGVTGRSGSGKSTVAQYFAALGYPVCNGDDLSRIVTVPGSDCLSELVTAFGDGILQEDGALNRKVLGRMAFACPEQNARLIEITHPHILIEFLRQQTLAQKAGHVLFFLDGAVIVGTRFRQHCNRLIVVVSPTKLSVSRIILRDGISKPSAYQRLDAQMDEETLCREADYVIRNDAGMDSLLNTAGSVLEELLLAAAGR